MSAPGARPRLYLVDDHRLMLEGMALALRDQYEIVGCSQLGEGVAEACRELLPDAVLLDLSLPDRSGLEVIMDLREAVPDARVIVVTMHADRIMADASFQSGAHGFVPKDAGTAELKQALEHVLAGGLFISELIPKQTHHTTPTDSAVWLGRLTPRQQQIVRMLGEGKRTQDIARELSIDKATVTFHRARIRKALGIDTEWGLVRYALLVRMSEQEARRREAQ
ncbi:MAG TPA: response regulator transcription factor [Gemmatimonadales bacterium]|nr:response regulator transcription factor [Gemmatimonadales bacterium]